MSLTKSLWLVKKIFAQTNAHATLTPASFRPRLPIWWPLIVWELLVWTSAPSIKRLWLTRKESNTIQSWKSSKQICNVRDSAPMEAIIYSQMYEMVCQSMETANMRSFREWKIMQHLSELSWYPSECWALSACAWALLSAISPARGSRDRPNTATLNMARPRTNDRIANKRNVWKTT